MTQWVPMPQTLDELHPLVVHFPLALLLVAPVFIFLGLLRPRQDWRFGVAALLLLLLGTAGAYVAVLSGVAAGQLAEQSEPIQKTLLEHQNLAEWTRLIFSILTVVYGLLLALPLVWKTAAPRALSAIHLVFLIVFAGSTLILARTGHLGGVLVHTHGVRAMLSDGESAPPAPPAAADENQPTTQTQTAP